jgi:hypothetical protein
MKIHGRFPEPLRTMALLFSSKIGEVVAAIEEERLNRISTSTSFRCILCASGVNNRLFTFVRRRRQSASPSHGQPGQAGAFSFIRSLGTTSQCSGDPMCVSSPKSCSAVSQWQANSRKG